MKDHITLAVRRPDLLVRKLRGKSVIEISPEEALRYVPNASVIVEAGAFDGADTVRLSTLWPSATVHAFEPVPSAYAQVEERTRDLPNVHRYKLALSDSTGEAEMHVSSAGDGADRPDSSSLLRPAEHLELMPDVKFNETIRVSTITLDTWGGEQGVERVDFMWLDMQGLELPVLRASPKTVATVQAVCMEVSRRELYEGCAIYPEVMSWMRDQGFRPVIDRVSVYFGNVLFVRP